MGMLVGEWCAVNGVVCVVVVFSFLTSVVGVVLPLGLGVVVVYPYRYAAQVADLGVP